MTVQELIAAAEVLAEQHPAIESVAVSRDHRTLLVSLNGSETIAVSLQSAITKQRPVEDLIADIEELVQRRMTLPPQDAVLLPVLRGHDLYGHAAHIDLGHPLFSFVAAVDSPTMTSFPQAEEWQRTGLTIEALAETALMNVKRMQVTVAAAGQDVTRVVSIQTERADLEASWALLCPDELRALYVEHDIPQPWMLCVPNRRTVALGSAAREWQIALMTAVLAYDFTHGDNEYAVMPLPLQVDDNGVAGAAFEPSMTKHD